METVDVNVNTCQLCDRLVNCPLAQYQLGLAIISQ